MKVLSLPSSVGVAILGVLVGIFACLTIALGIVKVLPLPSVIAFEISLVVIGIASGYISSVIVGYGGRVRIGLSSAWNIGFCAGATSRAVAWLQKKHVDADLATIVTIGALVFGITVGYLVFSPRRRDMS